jgi:hypothetical protein
MLLLIPVSYPFKRKTDDLPDFKVNQTAKALNESGSSFFAPLPFGSSMLKFSVPISQVKTYDFQVCIPSGLSDLMFLWDNPQQQAGFKIMVPMILPDSKQSNLVGLPDNKQNDQAEQNEQRAKRLSASTEKQELFLC